MSVSSTEVEKRESYIIITVRYPYIPYKADTIRNKTT